MLTNHNDLDDYHNFYLQLTWNNGLSVEQVELKRHNNELLITSVTQKTAAQNPPTLASLSDPSTVSQLVSFGTDIANILLPIGEVRTNFRNDWLKYKKIRLWLLYPEVEHIEKLLEIPYEYIYLPLEKNNENPPQDLKYLLGRREDISIVHCVNPARLSDPDLPNRSNVNKLRVSMNYLSWFPQEQAVDEKRLFDDFIEEIPGLEPIIHCRNISGSIPSSVEKIQGEPTDVVIAFQKDQFVHLTSHGDAKKVMLKENENLTSTEIHGLFEVRQEESQIKVAVLLNCLSGGGSLSVAYQLHQDDVPMVIGMSGLLGINEAGRFIDGFYKAIAAWPNQGLERAVVEGRNSIFRQESGGNWNKDFGLPRFYLNRPNSLLIPEELLYGSSVMIRYFDNHIRTSLAEIDNHRNVSISSTVDYQKRLNEWIYGDITRWLFVSGVSGSGKSTQIVQFVNTYMEGLPLLRANAKDDQAIEIDRLIKRLRRKQHPKLIYHFCRSEQPETGDPLTFILHSLVPQLAQHFGKQYYTWCPRNKFPLLTDNAKDALIDFVYIPLYKAKQLGKKPPVIVIDGLDFIPPGHGFDSSILGLLHDHRDKLDSVARFIVTADTVEDGNERAKQIRDVIMELTHQVTPLNVLPPELADEDEAGEKSVREVFDRLNIKLPSYLSQSKRQLGSKAASSEKPRAPTPLFERMVERFKDFFSDDSLTGTLSLEELASSDGLDKLYEFALCSAREYLPKDVAGLENKIQQFLDVIALAYEPLSPNDVAAIIDVKLNEMDKLLEAFCPFLAECKNPDPSSKDYQKPDLLKFFHHSLRDYVRRDIQGRNNDTIIHDLFVKAFLPPQILSSTTGNNAKPDWATLEGTQWHKRYAANSSESNNSKQVNSLAPTYVRRYLSYHAYERYQGMDWSNKECRQKYAREFLALTGEPGFRIARLAEVGRDAVVQDIKRGLRVVYTEYGLLSNNEINHPAVKAIDHILAANEFDFQYLEQQLRNGQADVRALFKFLDLDPHSWEAQSTSDEACHEIRAE